MPAMSPRLPLVVLGVMLAHGGLIWLTQQHGGPSGVDELVVEAEIIGEIVTPPAPKLAPQVQTAPLPKPQPPRPVTKVEPPAPTPPAPLPQVEPEPTVQAEPQPPEAQTQAQQAAVEPQPSPESAPIKAPVVAQESAAPPPAQRVERPSVDASYLYNPKPAYPAASRRLNEQGTTVIRVLVAENGSVLKTEIGESSGYERLDRAALSAVRRWRYLPGKRDNVAEAMWFNVPVSFVLEQ